MGNMHMKRSSTSLVVREMQIKTTMRYHFIPTILVIIFKTNKMENNMLVKMWRNWNPYALLVGI